MMKTFSKFAFTCVLAISLSACSGGQKFFDTANMVVSTHGTNDSYVDLSATFEMGNVSLTEATFNVVDPNNHNNVGSVSFQQLPSGKGTVSLSVNMTTLVHADPDLGLALPNGNALPLSLNIERGDSMGIPVGDYSRVYLGGSLQTTLFAGLAIAIEGLDQVMDRLSTGANIFFMFRPNDNLMAVGGIYASPNPHQNGVAVFGKYSRSGGMLDEEIDESLDNDFYRLDHETQNRLMNFMYGEPKTIQLKNI
ncbi:MAG: hypothetical protein JST80_07200 [Bdellovibrionales bacterium]|nr:hypothetical protein [Bdellovibrionales bacterium]